MPAATISQGSIGFSAAHLGDRAAVQPAVLPMTGSVAAFSQSFHHPDRQGSEADSLAAAGGVCPFIHEVRDDA